MKKVLADRYFLTYLILFFLLNAGLYFFILKFNSRLPLESTFHYSRGIDHFIQDTRITQRRFNLLNALVQYDAQWYLKIASLAYPDLSQLKTPSRLAYAFFPLYPLVLSLFNFLVDNILVTAFIVSNLILVANFCLLYFLMKKYYSKKTIVKSLFLLFCFPGSIFFRSYFAEGLFLLLLIIFAYFLLSKRYWRAAFVLGLLNITKANAFFLNLYLIIDYYLYLRRKKEDWKKNILLILLISLPFFLWMAYCFHRNQDWFYIFKVRSNWFYEVKVFPLFFLYNLKKILEFPYLPWHDYYNSKIEVLAILLIGLLLLKNKFTIKKELWWIAFLLWLFPLLSTTTMSFSRYQIVSFPVFLILAKTLKKRSYYLVLAVFICGLLWASLYFVNWYWLG